MLVDPPARVSGYEADLTPAGVRASRFMHVSNYGRRRQTWFLTRITDEGVDRLDAEAWHELTPVSDRGALHLLLLSPEERQSLPSEGTPPRAPSAPPEPAAPEGVRSAPLPEAASRPLPPVILAPPAAPVSVPPGGTAPLAPTEAPSLPEGVPQTGLVRHLRRQLASERLSRKGLEARVVTLERRLVALNDGLAPIALDPDTAEDA